MNTHSHAAFTFAALSGHPQVGLAVLGSVFPDLLMFAATPYIALRHRIGLKQAHNKIHHIRELDTAIETCHSFLVLGVAFLLAWAFAPWLLMFCWGWLSHLLIDFFTHHEGGHPPFYPLHHWKFKSPISFYEPERYGRPFAVVEHFGIALVVGFFLPHGPLLVGIGTLALAGFLLAKRISRHRLGAPSNHLPMV